MNGDTARSVRTVGYLLEIVNEARFQVTGETCVKVAEVIEQAQELTRRLIEGELEVIDRALEAGPPPEGDDDVPF